MLIYLSWCWCPTQGKLAKSKHVSNDVKPQIFSGLVIIGLHRGHYALVIQQKKTFNKVWAKWESENSFQKTCGGTCYLWLIGEKDLSVLIIILKARLITLSSSELLSMPLPSLSVSSSPQSQSQSLIITWKLAPFGLNRNCVNFSLKKLSFLITVSKLASVFLNLFT